MTQTEGARGFPFFLPIYRGVVIVNEMEPHDIPVTAIRSALMDLSFGEPTRKDTETAC